MLVSNGRVRTGIRTRTTNKSVAAVELPAIDEQTMALGTLEIGALGVGSSVERAGGHKLAKKGC